MGYKRVVLDVNCGGHVSDETFDEFLKTINKYADNLFDGEIGIKYVITTDNKKEVDVIPNREQIKGVIVNTRLILDNELMQLSLILQVCLFNTQYVTLKFNEDKIKEIMDMFNGCSAWICDGDDLTGTLCTVYMNTDENKVYGIGEIYNPENDYIINDRY